VGRRSRNRNRQKPTQEQPQAPQAQYTDPDGNTLALRGSLSAATRRDYAEILAGGLDQEDAWQRGGEFLFERLAVSWTIAGIETKHQQELLARYRVATQQERQFIRESLRAHVLENFPELQAP
jgi:hypothetical protein